MMSYKNQTPLKEKINTLGHLQRTYAKRSEDDEYYIPRPVLYGASFNEILAFLHGLKPAIGVRVEYDLQKCEEIKKWAETRGLYVAFTKQKFVVNSNLNIFEFRPLDDPLPGDVYACIAHEKSNAEYAAQWYGKSAYKFGYAMGYPECCLEFGEALSGNVHDPVRQENDMVWSRVHFRSYRNSERFDKHLNIFQVSPLISHIPCHLNCTESKRYAKKVLKLLKGHNVQIYKLQCFSLGLASLFFGIAEAFIFDGRLRHNRLKYADFMASWFSEKLYKDAPDRTSTLRYRTILSLVKRSNEIVNLPDKLLFLKNGDYVGAFRKERPYQCLLAQPGSKPFEF
jgi:hypothetical protein